MHLTGKLHRGAAIIAAALVLSSTALTPMAVAAEDSAKPTVLLVHGAFADSTSWGSVVVGLEKDGYKAIAVANPLRSLKGDAAYVGDLIKSIKGPVVLVGHSYGGAVITDAAEGNDNVKALVYVAALAPDAGESAFDLVGKFPGSTLGAALQPPVALSGEAHDLYVDPGKFAGALAADVPASEEQKLAAAQRPVTDVALKEPSGAPAWKHVPSWFVFGNADKSIPAATHTFMANRAKARKVVVAEGASHLVMVSHADAVKKLVEEAASAR